MTSKFFLKYKEAGVDIDTGDSLVKRIKYIARKTHRPEVKGKIGNFGALFALPKKYKEPILVSSTDGVGTKLCLAMEFKQLNSIGIDLVAMCVNDVVVQGAEPLFFLDYYATGKIEIETAVTIINGIAKGCLESGCALVGGETAEMPSIYNGQNYDMAGFCVGIVEKSKIINSSKVQNGDVLVALGSSGLHSNGYSLVRKILEVNQINPDIEKVDGKNLSTHLLTPTRIYVKNILKLIKQVKVHSIAHITGGGFWSNIPRILPSGTQAILKESSWQWPPIFKWLQEAGKISRYEMYRTFNCGVGMVIILSEINANKAIKLMNDAGEIAWKIGVIKNYNDKNQVKIIL